MLKNTTILAEDTCPACGCKLDAAFGIDVQYPEPNDLTVCINCSFILVFDDRLKVRKVTKEDLASLDEETRHKLSLVVEAVNDYRRSKN